AADGWRQTPHAAASGSKFGDFFPRKFQNSVRRVGADGMKRTRLALAQPVEAIRMVNPIHFLFANKFNYRRKTSSAKRVSTMGEMDTKVTIGRFLRKLREQK